jgi:hypothetical protein
MTNQDMARRISKCVLLAVATAHLMTMGMQSTFADDDLPSAENFTLNLLRGKKYSLYMRDVSGRGIGDLSFSKFDPPDWVSDDGQVTITGQSCPANWLTDGVFSKDEDTNYFGKMPHNQWRKYREKTPKTAPYLQFMRQQEFSFNFPDEMLFDRVVLHARHNPYDFSGNLPLRYWVMATTDRKTFTLGKVCNTYKDIDTGNMRSVSVKIELADMNLRGKTLVIISPVHDGSCCLEEAEAYGRKIMPSDPLSSPERLYDSTVVFPVYDRSEIYLADRYFYFFPNAGLAKVTQRVRVTVPPEVEIGPSYRYKITDLGKTKLFDRPAHAYQLDQPASGAAWLDMWYWRCNRKGPFRLGKALIEGFSGSDEKGYTKAIEQRFETYAVNVPWTAVKPKRLVASAPWFYVSLLAGWPDFAQSYGQTGLNAMNFREFGLPGAGLYDRDFYGERGGYRRAFPDCPKDFGKVIDDMVAAGVRPVGNFVINPHSPVEPNPAPYVRLMPAGKTQRILSAICPSYFAGTYANVYAELYRWCGRHGFQYFYHDYEVTAGGRGWDHKGCFCDKCKERFRLYLKKNCPQLSPDKDPVQFMSTKDLGFVSWTPPGYDPRCAAQVKPEDKPYQDAWMQFWYDFLGQFFQKLKTAATEGLATRGEGPAQIIQHEGGPWSDGRYEAFRDYETLRRFGVFDGTGMGLSDSGSLNRNLGATFDFYVAALPPDVKPALFSCTYEPKEMSPRFQKHQLLNAYAAGLQILLMDNGGRDLTPLDYQMLSEVMHQVTALENIICDGKPLTSNRVMLEGGGWGHGRATDTEALIYATYPWLADKSTIKWKTLVQAPASENAKVVDMSSGKILPCSFHDGILKFTATFERDDANFVYNEGKIFHIIYNDRKP